MKRRLSIILSVFICTLLFVGCRSNTDVVVKNNVVSNSNENRFVQTDDKYSIGGHAYNIYYDSITEIVYLNGEYSTDLMVLYDSDGKPMTIKEYNETK